MNSHKRNDIKCLPKESSLVNLMCVEGIINPFKVFWFSASVEMGEKIRIRKTQH